MYKFSMIDKISFILVIIGAVNWGLIGLLNFNLVSYCLGAPADFISRSIYIVVGIAGIDMILFMVKSRKSSKSSK